MTPANMKNPIHLLAFGLGSGLAKKAPGTFGTIAAVPVWWFLLQGIPTLPYVGILLAGFAFGVVICEITSRDMGVHDHGGPNVLLKVRNVGHKNSLIWMS